jgi:hypothetical protein
MASTIPSESGRSDLPTSHHQPPRWPTRLRERGSSMAAAPPIDLAPRSHPDSYPMDRSGPLVGTSYVAHCPIFPGCCENQRLRRRFWGVSVLTLRPSQRPQKPLKTARQHSVDFGTSRAPRNAAGQGVRVTRAVPFPESRSGTGFPLSGTDNGTGQLERSKQAVASGMEDGPCDVKKRLFSLCS